MSTLPYKNLLKPRPRTKVIRYCYNIVIMKASKILIVVGCVTMGLAARAQSTNDFLIAGGLDLFKTDNTKLFDKAQVAFEVNYFLQRRFSVSGGAELWTRGKNSFAMGVRYYPMDNFFVRFRGLIGGNDVSLGAGYSYPLSKSWRAEGMGDLYFARPDFAIRGGVSYVINYVTLK